MNTVHTVADDLLLGAHEIVYTAMHVSFSVLMVLLLTGKLSYLACQTWFTYPIYPYAYLLFGISDFISSNCR